MIPTVRLDGAAKALLESRACFIQFPGYVIQEARELLREADLVLRGLEECPPLDAKTMFPSSLATNAATKRRVIQRFVYPVPPAPNTPREVVAIQDRMLSITKQMHNAALIVVTDICKDHRVSDQVYRDLRDPTEWVLNIAHYPFNAGEKGQVLFPAHKDWGTLAVYPCIEGEGLEVSLDGKSWTQVQPPPDTMFCYAGDILQRVTPVEALLHRVVQPTNEGGGRTACIFYADTSRKMVLPSGERVGDIIDGKLRKIGQIQ
jgi:isopenicillin N synthase-like dioxygenase